MTVQDLAAKAAGEIRRRGWYQGDYGSDAEHPQTCAVCLLGAINAAQRGDPWDEYPNEEWRALVEGTIEEKVGQAAYGWNDNALRTEAEVLALLDAIAAAA